eukprot:2737602-Amphidinium_carterae.1
MQGLYWSISTMFAGASHVNPQNATEAYFSTIWLVMGAMFVTSITSTLAAALIKSHEKQQDMNHKLHLLTAFMRQQKTPVLLSLAVLVEYKTTLMSTNEIVEADVPFLDSISPNLRAALREHRYAEHVLRFPFLGVLCVAP